MSRLAFVLLSPSAICSGYQHWLQSWQFLCESIDMWRFIFLALVVALIVYLFKRQAIQPGNSHPDSNATGNKPNDGGDSDGKHIEDMVQCAQCAVHLPRSEAYLVSGKFYCSKEHIRRS